ncbi:MAG: hypothetical protein HYU80_00575 [Candidatus Blackburnbacteria bacterium]|nr:hypothetical protein [Candidatus Blackburnbacteria bacterium]
MEIAQLTNPVVDKLSPKSGEGAVDQLSGILSTIVSVLIIAGALIFTLYFIMGAIRWITSGGDKGQLESARNQVLHAVIGLLVLFSVFALLKLIGVLFNINLLNIDLGRIKL